MAKDHASEPRFRIAQIIRDPALRKALGAAEDALGPIPVLPKDESGASGSDDARSIFHCAFSKVMESRALRDLISWRRGRSPSGSEESEMLSAAGRAALEDMNKKIACFAELPAMTRSQLQWKKAVIGTRPKENVFSEAIARDEAYLGTKATAHKRVIAQPSGEAGT